MLDLKRNELQFIYLVRILICIEKIDYMKVLYQEYFILFLKKI